MKNMGEKYKTVSIVGTGIMGLTMAYRLMKQGLNVRLLELDLSEGKSSTSYFAGGLLSPVSELEKADHKIHALGMESLDLWDEILGDIGVPHLIKKDGSLVVAHERDVPLLKRFAEKIRAAGFESQIKAVDADEIADLEPILAGRFSIGYFIEGEGHLQTREVFSALRKYLENSNVEFISEVEVGYKDGKLETGIESDLTIDCRGIGAQDRFPDLRGVKGEIAIVQTAELSLNRPVRMMHPRYPLYIVPREDNIFLIGATEIETSDMSAVTIRSALELLSALYALHPSFGEADILELGTHVRPAFSDNDPRIIFEGDQMAINGLYRHGYLISPALALEACTLLEGGDHKQTNQVA